MKNNNIQEAKYLTEAYKAVLNADSMDAETKLKTLKRLTDEAQFESMDVAEHNHQDDERDADVYESYIGDEDQEGDDDDWKYDRSCSDVISDGLFGVTEFIGNTVDAALSGIIDFLDNIF